MSSRKKIFSSAGIVASSTFLSRILGLIRDIVIAWYFGASSTADTFFVAFRIPNLFRRLLAEGSLTTAYIPVFSRLLNDKGEKDAYLFAESSFRFFGLFLFLFCILGVAISPLIIRITAPGFMASPDQASLAIELTRIMFPYLFFICLVALCMGILNSLEHFTAPAIAPVFLNISMISSVLFFSDFFEKPVYALAAGVLAGGVVQLGFQFPFLFKKGVNPFKGISLWHEKIPDVLRLMGPSVFGAAVYQISILINTILASYLPEGSVSYLYYSDRLVQFPLAIFGITAGIVVLPVMSKQVASGSLNQVRDTLSEGLCFILFLTIPSTAGLIILGNPIISMLFERKSFTPEMRDGTYIALVCYSLGLFSASGVRILVSFFYSFKDSKTAVRAGIIAFGTNILMAFVLMYFFSYAGLALAVSCGSLVNLIFLVYKVKKRIYNLNWKTIGKRSLLIIFSTLIMSVAVYFLDSYLEIYFKTGTFNSFVRVCLGIITGVTVYFSVSFVLRVPETITIKKLLRRNS